MNYENQGMENTAVLVEFKELSLDTPEKRHEKTNGKHSVFQSSSTVVFVVSAFERKRVAC